MFGKKNKSGESFSFSIEAENLAVPEIHVREYDKDGVLESEDGEATDGKTSEKAMSVMDAILKRCSVREFTDQKISKEDVKTILAAGMAGPSACNSRDWSFVVVDDNELLGKMADANGPAAEPLRGAALGILICGDVEKAFDKAKEFWIIDGAIAAQNMILAAKGLGIGSVWLGTWPQEDKVKHQSKLFDLPAEQVPHSLIAFGYAAGVADQTKDTWDESVVHYNKW